MKVLVVTRWPLGGIRAYMKYVYKHFPKEKINISLIAPVTNENEALGRDTKDLGLQYIPVDLKIGLLSFIFQIFKTLLKEKHALIQSHGFISAICAWLPSIVFQTPHIITIHGIIEKRLLGQGFLAKMRLFLLNRVLKSSTYIIAVSNDILENVLYEIKLKKTEKCHVIYNGIDTQSFVFNLEITKEGAREFLGLPKDKFVIGFIGRFMPQKGFSYLIDAVEFLKGATEIREFVVAAVGSGDYLKYYQSDINKRNLEKYFIFIPFQGDIKPVYKAIDLLVMPSVWEAFPLQPAEAMVMGVPIIVSECIGLRECVKGTPAIVIPVKNPQSIFFAIYNSFINYKDIEIEFKNFIPIARKKFDVRKTVNHMTKLFENV